MVRPIGETPETDNPAGGQTAGLSHVWMVTLPFETPPLTYNRMQGKHWGVVHREKTKLIEAGYYLSRTRHAVVLAHEYAGPVDLDLDSSRRLALPRPFARPVTIELLYLPGNNTVHDSDNMAPTLKYLVDGLRRGGALTDDRGRYARSSICTVIERDDDPRHRAGPLMALVVREL
jgi:hypothetical protein